MWKRCQLTEGFKNGDWRISNKLIKKMDVNAPDAILCPASCRPRKRTVMIAQISQVRNNGVVISEGGGRSEYCASQRCQPKALPSKLYHRPKRSKDNQAFRDCIMWSRHGSGFLRFQRLPGYFVGYDELFLEIFLFYFAGRLPRTVMAPSWRREYIEQSLP